MAAILLFAVLIASLLLTVPISVALGLAALVVILVLEPVTLESFTQAMIQGLNSFPLMAVPFFTFAGDIMGKGGISKRLLNVTSIILGKMTGGLAVVSIVACLFFAAISGTGSATVAAIGMIMLPAMIQRGYDKVWAGALISTGGTVGVIIPPSVCMVIYSVAAGSSVTGIFMAGFGPGILIGIALIAYAYYCSKKRGWQGESHNYTAGEIVKILIDAIPAFLVPVIVLGGIYCGVFTPTEAAVIASIYGIIASVFIYREVKIRDLPYIGFHSCLICAAVLFIIGISTGFGRILTITQVPVTIANLILDITNNKYLVLLFINILLLIVGTFMETNSAIIILVPILLPVLNMLGINIIHFGIIMVLNLAIGFITPPLGANLFMTCQISDIKFDNLARAIFPWVLVMCVVLAIVTYVPAISLWFPRWLGIPVGS